MADPVLLISELLSPVFDGADPVVRPSDRADYQANGVLPLAKARGANPRELGLTIVALAAVALEGVATVEVAGPGFLNVTLTSSFIADQLNAVANDARLGVHGAAAPERVVVDYSAPNVAKEMHVGHLRSTVIGDSLVRLLGYVGHEVLRENHIGDWGTPFGMLIEHLLDIGEHDAISVLSASDLTVFYKQARVKFDGSDPFQLRAQERVVKLQAGDPETLRLWKVLIDQSAHEFQTTYDRLGVLLRPADIVGESFYNPMLDDVVRDLDTLGLLSESNGAKVAYPGGYKNREGDELPLIVRNSQGGSNYATTDLATVRDRVDRLGATWLLYVVGSPQAQHLAMVWKVASLAGWLTPPARCMHVAFGSVLGEDRKMLRTRTGDTFKLADLIDEAIERAEAAIVSKNPAITGDERTSVARAVGIGAIKYADLSSDRIKDYMFAWDRMLAFEGNTAPYLQYAIARIRSIVRKSETFEPGHPIVIEAPQERALAVALLGFDASVWDTIDKLAPHRLCTYLFELAQSFTSFYEACPVLSSSDPTRSSRLALCDLTARVLAAGLDLLGIESPERM